MTSRWSKTTCGGGGKPPVIEDVVITTCGYTALQAGRVTASRGSATRDQRSPPERAGKVTWPLAITNHMIM